MRMIYRVFALASMSCGIAATAQAAVEVSFDHPEQYADAETRRAASGSDLTPTLTAIESQFQYLGTRYLAADQQLKVEILDVDLAGRY